MSTETLHPLAAEYMARLRRASRELPRRRREELLADLNLHLLDAIDADASDAEALNALERLGDPADIVAAAGTPPDGSSPGPRSSETAAPAWLLWGGFLFGVGWFIGVAKLWNARAWTVREKAIGTLIVPFGLAGSVLFALRAISRGSRRCVSESVAVPAGGGFYKSGPATLHCTGGWIASSEPATIALVVIAILAPFVTVVYLRRRLG